MPFDPQHAADADYLRWERVGWLKTLIADRKRLDPFDPERDVDPSATAEMLRECEALAAELERELPDTPAPEPVKVDPSIPF